MFESQRLPITNELAPNTISKFEKFHISYNASSSGYGTDTTALVIANHVFLILWGNHKTKMQQRASEDGMQGAFDYFIENINLAHYRGEHMVASGTIQEDQFNIYKVALRELGPDNVEKLRKACEKFKGN